MKRTALLLVLLSGWLAGPAWSEDSAEQAGKPTEAAVPAAKVHVTEHSTRIGGRTIAYTATAGTLLMKNDKDEPEALMGFTAYVAKGIAAAERPILFAYNGGPGSASLWLHMGVLGPQRALVEDVGRGSRGPFRRVQNEYSILDEADLVMIDPVGTGFSKPVGKAKGEDFWGVDQDIRSVSAFIVQYLNKYGRWASPKYVLGESYGGMRTGGVAYRLLTQHMVTLNGVILVSPFMAMASGFAGLGIDLPHVMYLPTLAATARYHGVLQPSPPDLEAFMDEVTAFAFDEYAPALLKGHRLGTEEKQSVIDKLVRYTGLDAGYWQRADLRIDEGRFTQELLRERGITVSRIDSRFLGNTINRLGESASYDPMISVVGPGYLAAFMDYYRNDLKVTEAGSYVVFGDVFGKWDWSHAQPDLGGFKAPFPNTNVDLSMAMQQNPKMKVLVQQGYYDLATPHLTTQHYIDHLDIADELRGNVELELYEAGHMMYLHTPSLVKYKDDLARFIQESH